MTLTERRSAAVRSASPITAGIAWPPAPASVNRPRNLPRVTYTCAALGGAIAATGLAGWIFDVTSLKQVVPGLGTMKVNTGIALMLLALAWFVPRRVGNVFASLVAALATLVLLEYATGTGFGIDQLLARDAAGSSYPGRLSVATACGVGFLAIARLVASVGWLRRAQALTLAVVLLSALTLVAYCYDVPSLYQIRPFTTIALPTTCALLLLSTAALASIRGGALSWAVLGQDAGASLVRQLLPLALVGLPALGYVCVRGERHGWWDAFAAIAIFAVVCGLAVGVLTWMAAVRLARVDRRRVYAITELTDLKNDLERQVEERATQLRLGHDQIAVLEDRQRIAADLHDIVIQRLFAAGMFLQGAGAIDPAAQKRVDTAVESMDIAIKDLRASIFELGGGRAPVPLDLIGAIDDVCIDSARVLGFTPDVTVDDPDWAADSARDDLLAVLREALANVARHAQASVVDVVLRSSGGVVVLTVTDDGQGMSPAARSSGTRNMRERARRRGGECEWISVYPHGTQVRWRVPVSA